MGMLLLACPIIGEAAQYPSRSIAMQPLVSLVMTVYNRAPYLAQAIESVINQSERDFELIILDDGSTDSSATIAQTYAKIDPRIRVIKAKHQGRGYALSTALSFASGGYLALLDSDDWLAKTALAETVSILEALPEVNMVYSNYYDVDESGQVLKLGYRSHIPYSKDRLLLDFMTFHFRLFRKAAYEKIGGINPEFTCAPDYDLCLKLSEVGEVIHLEKPLYFYRSHEASISALNKLEQMQYSHQAVRDALVRRGLSTHISVEVGKTSNIVLKRLPASIKNHPQEKVFGIGLGRTGTTSLCQALGHLGYRTIHLPQQLNLTEQYDAAGDVSVAVAFRELDWRYPNAKFILTVRPIDEWLASWQSHDTKMHRLMNGKLAGWLRRLRIQTFGQCEFDPVVWRKAYQRHYQEVVDYFEQRAHKLLLYSLCDGDGWESLCHFLEMPIPQVAFPHRNASSRQGSKLPALSLCTGQKL